MKINRCRILNIYVPIEGVYNTIIIISHDFE